MTSTTVIQELFGVVGKGRPRDHVPRHETYAYSSSKAAVHQLSRHLAAQLVPFSVTVNVIAPGMFKSKMLKGMLEQHGEEAVLAPVPLKRFVSPSDRQALPSTSPRRQDPTSPAPSFR
jgi:NAD(P)-dependent dehydrogenase (short-subunit alcohol dehydrogenase family)